MLALDTLPVDILAETFNTIRDIVRGNAENQKFLRCFINTLDKLQQPALFDLLSRIAIDTKQSFQLQISILYCLKYFLYKNDTGKSMLIQTLLPLTENV